MLKYPALRFQVFQFSFPIFPSNQTVKRKTKFKYSAPLCPSVCWQKLWLRKRKLQILILKAGFIN